VSLRLRLALWYGTLTAAVVALVCLYSYAVHSRTHYDELDVVLRRAAEHVGADLAAAAPTERSHVLDASLTLGVGIRVVDSDGKVVEQSVNVGSAPWIDPRRVLTTAQRPPYPAVAALAPAQHEVTPGPGALSVALGANGARFRVFVYPIAGGSQYLVALLPLSHIDGAVARFGRLMAVMAALGGLATFLAGWVLARRALRPVSALTETARAITRSRVAAARVRVGESHDELGQLAHTFNEMLASLDNAYQAQQRFVSAASHELRAPLTVVQANLELLQDGRGRLSDEERSRALREAFAEAGRMARLVADLLALARADAGVPLRRAPVELDRVLLEVIAEARHLTRGHRVEVEALESTTVTGDRDRLKQLMLILVDNAIRYTPAGGRITVRLARSGATAELRVRDTGDGIRAEDLPRVFERFFRGDPARSRDPGGTGLGLSIAQWIAREHGGEIDLASVRGEGTTAVFRMAAG